MKLCLAILLLAALTGCGRQTNQSSELLAREEQDPIAKLIRDHFRTARVANEDDLQLRTMWECAMHNAANGIYGTSVAYIRFQSLMSSVYLADFERFESRPDPSRRNSPRLTLSFLQTSQTLHHKVSDSEYIYVRAKIIDGMPALLLEIVRTVDSLNGIRKEADNAISTDLPGWKSEATGVCRIL